MQAVLAMLSWPDRSWQAGTLRMREHSPVSMGYRCGVIVAADSAEVRV